MGHRVEQISHARHGAFTTGLRPLAVAAAVLASGVSLRAATFTVNSTTDAVDATRDGVCETATGNGVCTLRAAIQEANFASGADVITLPGGTYTIALTGRDEDQAATGDLDVSDDLTIVGNGAESTIIDGIKNLRQGRA